MSFMSFIIILQGIILVAPNNESSTKEKLRIIKHVKLGHQIPSGKLT